VTFVVAAAAGFAFASASAAADGRCCYCCSNCSCCSCCCGGCDWSLLLLPLLKLLLLLLLLLLLVLLLLCLLLLLLIATAAAAAALAPACCCCRGSRHGEHAPWTRPRWVLLLQLLLLSAAACCCCCGCMLPQLAPLTFSPPAALPGLPALPLSSNPLSAPGRPRLLLPVLKLRAVFEAGLLRLDCGLCSRGACCCGGCGPLLPQLAPRRKWTLSCAPLPHPPLPGLAVFSSSSRSSPSVRARPGLLLLLLPPLWPYAASAADLLRLDDCGRGCPCRCGLTPQLAPRWELTRALALSSFSLPWQRWALPVAGLIQWENKAFSAFCAPGSALSSLASLLSALVFGYVFV